jgi:High potential iron-sulfur protein
MRKACGTMSDCSNCSLFQEPNACTLVGGEISPAGWCKFWVKKAG